MCVIRLGHKRAPFNKTNGNYTVFFILDWIKRLPLLTFPVLLFSFFAISPNFRHILRSVLSPNNMFPLAPFFEISARSFLYVNYTQKVISISPVLSSRLLTWLRMFGICTKLATYCQSQFGRNSIVKKLVLVLDFVWKIQSEIYRV